jgi:hypothetical protein
MSVVNILKTSGESRNPADLNLAENSMVMKKITFSADEYLLDRAERIAKQKGATLESEIRQWLDDLGSGKWKLPKGSGERARRE